MSDFSDRPFVAGNVTGLRAFRIDSLGRLTGIVHQDVWRPGENEAVCHASEQGDMYVQQMTQMIAAFDRKTGKKRDQNYYSLSRPAPKPKHEVAGLACQCGFYAYFDGGNDYLTRPTPSLQQYTAYVVWGGTASDEDRAPRVAAIVNGWGLVTIGDRGFRASKAEVVALISPDSEQARHEVAFAKVRRNYPDLTVFSSEREAVREFPLTDPIGASPADEDFWTRAAR